MFQKLVQFRRRDWKSEFYLCCCWWCWCHLGQKSLILVWKENSRDYDDDEIVVSTVLTTPILWKKFPALPIFFGWLQYVLLLTPIPLKGTEIVCFWFISFNGSCEYRLTNISPSRIWNIIINKHSTILRCSSRVVITTNFK